MQFEKVWDGPQTDDTRTMAPPPVPRNGDPAPETPRRKGIEEGTKNLLKHIPGESSGFYLMAMGSLDNPSRGAMTVVFALAFVLLIVVRWAAKASVGIMATSVVAFIIWMFAIDNGYFRIIFPDVLPGAMGLIVAGFYSAVVTALSSAGKIR